MAKKNKINIVSAWTWLTNVFDTNNLSASEQLTLVHLIKFINRNYWLPIQIPNAALARSIGKDSRTVARAIGLLLQKKIITLSDDGRYFINIEDKLVNTINESESTKRNLINDTKRLHTLAKTNRLSVLDEMQLEKQAHQEQLQKLTTQDLVRGILNQTH